MNDRDFRQRVVASWVERCFGNALDRKERARRLLEEAIELAQAEEVPLEFVSALAAHVYSRKPGVPEQEVGGVALTLLAYADAIGSSADALELLEIERILDLEPGHFRRRQSEKAKLGLGRKPEP